MVSRGRQRRKETRQSPWRAVPSQRNGPMNPRGEAWRLFSAKNQFSTLAPAEASARPAKSKAQHNIHLQKSNEMKVETRSGTRRLVTPSAVRRITAKRREFCDVDGVLETSRSV